MIRRPLLIVAIVVLVAGLLINGGWFYARWLAGRSIDEWAAAQRAAGIDVTWQSREFYGWPLRLDGLFRAPQAVITAPNRQIVWNGADSAIRYYLLDPKTVDFGTPGRHDFSISENGTTETFTLDAKTLDARVETGVAGAFNNLAAGGTGLTLRGPDDASLAAARAVQFLWEQPPLAESEAGAPPVSLRLAARADALELAPHLLPPSPAPVMGNEISVLRVDLALNGAIDPHLPVPEALAAWRDAAGTIDVSRIEIVWGPMRLVGDGTAALDAALQPEGAFAARISGFGEVLTAMERASMIDARTAAIARITLAVLTRPAEDGGPPQARIPLTIQNRVLSAGPVALLKLPMIVWR